MKRSIPWAACAALVISSAVAGVVGAQQRPRRQPRPRPASRAHPSITDDMPCSACHTPEGWAQPGGSSGGGGFDHSQTGFALRGRHRAAGCTDCHSSEREAQRDCVSCHVDTHEGRLGTDCSTCHNAVSFRDTDELAAHRLTRMPLTGMHAIVACTDCHQRNGSRAFTAVPATCISCHETDYRRPGLHPAHDGSGGGEPFSRRCETCHRTSGWSPAIVDPATLGSTSSGLREAAPPTHELRFPIRSGPHLGAPCASCHEDPRLPQAVRCTGCHAHSPARLRANHRTVPVPVDGRGCLGCHPGGAAR